MTAHIGYKNVFDDGLTFLDLDESAEQPFANALNDDLYSRWQFGTTGSAVVSIQLDIASNANYLAIYGHNLDGVSVQIERYNYGYITQHSFVIAGENTVFELFQQDYSLRWRITFQGLTGGEYITGLKLGRSLELLPLRAPFTPPDLFDNYEIINNQSIDSIPLGRVTRKAPFNVKIPQSLASRAWVDEHIQALADSINKKPFFFKWDDSRDNACLCWTVKPFKPPVYNNSKFQSFMIDAKGFK